LVSKHEVKGKEVHDARIVAAMLAHRVTHLLTFNTADFKRYTEIAAINPREV
jgi:predicted nucleic acid-binding protein